jgi:hypothetical protein
VHFSRVANCALVFFGVLLKFSQEWLTIAFAQQTRALQQARAAAMTLA